MKMHDDGKMLLINTHYGHFLMSRQAYGFNKIVNSLIYSNIHEFSMKVPYSVFSIHIIIVVTHITQ